MVSAMLNSKPKYLVRLDDASANFNFEKWTRLERLFDSLSIKPIVAVIPNNESTELHYNKPDLNFWEKVRNWQKKGWSIALSGSGIYSSSVSTNF